MPACRARAAPEGNAFIVGRLGRLVSKAHDPHWRYVALRLDGPRPVGRRALQNVLLGRARREGVPDEHAPQLTRLEWPHAIVKVHHHALAAARQWLPRIDFAVEGEQKVPLAVSTLSSSGTIKALTDRLRILQVRGEQQPAQGAGGNAEGPRGKPANGPRGKPANGPRGRASTPRRSAPSTTTQASGQDARTGPSRREAPQAGARSPSEPAAPPGARRRGIAPPARGPREE